LIDDNGRFIEAINESIDLVGQKGTFVSIMPLTKSVEGVTTSGLKYPLENATLTKGNTLGISNEIIEREAGVKISSGILLLIREKD